MKQCNDCGIYKLKKEYYIDRSTSCGLTRNCKVCNSLRSKRYRQSLCGRNKKTEIQLRYQKTDRGRAVDRANGSAYRARKLNQTCECCSNEEFIKVYEDRPDGYDVDHIIPLNKGGTHCVDNLQYLTIYDNRAKGDKLDYVTTGAVIQVTRAEGVSS